VTSSDRTDAVPLPAPEPLDRSQLEILRTCVHLGEFSPLEVTRAMLDAKARDVHTVHATLERLAEKGYLKTLSAGEPSTSSRYRAMAREELIRLEVLRFLHEEIGVESLAVLFDVVRTLYQRHGEDPPTARTN